MMKLYYFLKPAIPRRCQIFIRRSRANQIRKRSTDIWPIDPISKDRPEGWRGWPNKKKFAFVLSHDVDTLAGYQNVKKLSKLEKEIGFRSSYNFVPKRYGQISVKLVEELKRDGFGVGVHGLKHDGKLFSSKKIFDGRAPKINAYLKKWGTKGFTAPAMIRNHDWMHDFDINYSISTFDTDPFEPQPIPAKTMFPYWISKGSQKSGYLELPYTLPQDHLVYIILRERTIDIWKKKIDWIAKNGGMALLNSHPDYMEFEGDKPSNETYPVDYYANFLEYVKTEYADAYFHALPEEIHNFWINRKNNGRDN